MKKVITILAITSTIMILPGCFGITNDTPATDSQTTQTGTPVPQNFSIYQASDFSIAHPSAWEILKKEDFTSNVPTSTIAIFRNNIKNDIFTSNLNISQSAINEGVTSSDFGLQTLTTEKYNLVGFTEIKRENYTIGEGEKAIQSFITTFQGRKTITENLIEFKQLCIARNGYGIIITAAYLPNEDQTVTANIETMIKSFKFN